MALLEELMPFYGLQLEEGRFPEEKRAAVCVMCDIIENSPSGSDRYLSQFMPVLLRYAADTDPTLRQCAVFGLGQAAQHRGPVFRTYAPQAVPVIMATLRTQDARCVVFFFLFLGGGSVEERHACVYGDG
jgi:hypothetical protein